METSDEVREAAEDLQTFIAGGRSVDDACRRLVRIGVNAEVVDSARAVYEQRVGIISHLKEPTTVVADSGRRSWYGGPSATSMYWSEFDKQTRASLPPDVAADAMADIDAATSRILDLAGAPGWPEIRTKGLVLGYVQSGKTTNFMGVMAKAADAGYRLFIVLSGITDNLRSQTQERLEENLLGDHPERWYMLTSLEQDFAMSGNAANLLNDRNKHLIAVVKKNGFRLRRLNEWIKSAGSEVAKSVPLMIIDDEADQASLDVGKSGRISRINGLIGQMIGNPRSAYIAYTATPFANLLTDTSRYESLYPDDFIVEMKQPDGYFGPEKLFGREALSADEPPEVSAGLDVIRTIVPAEAEMAKPPSGKGAVFGWSPSVTPALADAINWFVLATAVRRARSGETKHSTMLVHTSMLAEAHNRMKLPVEAHRRALLERFTVESDVRQSLRELWERESAAVPATTSGHGNIPWEVVEAHVPAVLEATRVIVDNYTSQDRLYYKKDEPATVIVIGGNTLSRGLTLEGLVSSYFVRSASAYDTLLQMGRWFGYRRGYEDLPRIWIPEELAGWFQDLATVEEEIRREIRGYGPDITPHEVGVRIRTHPSMAITSAAKMRGAVDASISYSGKREQTITFQHKDEVWLLGNIEATRTLFATAIKSCVTVDDHDAGRIVVRGVDAEQVLDFLKAYKMHPNAVRLRSDLLTGYIRAQMEHGELLTWNLVMFENPTRKAVPDLDLGVGRMIRTIERSRLERYSAYANIKSLVSTIDRIADVGISRAELPTDVNAGDDSSLLRFRQDLLGGVGMLGFYPIDKHSQARNASAVKTAKQPRDKRTALEAVEHVIGLGLFFPQAATFTAYEYKTANIKVTVEDDSDEFDDIEAADERAAEVEVGVDAQADALTEAAPLRPSASVSEVPVEGGGDG